MEPMLFLATEGASPSIREHRGSLCVYLRVLKSCNRANLGPNQVCTLFGATGGSSLVSGPAYLSVGYGLDVKDIWRRDFTVLLGFFIAFQITQMLLIEYYPVCRRACCRFNYLLISSTAIHRRWWFPHLCEANSHLEEAERDSAREESSPSQG